MKVLVTGHEGYIGTVLVEELMAKGHEVSGLDAGYFSECNLVPITAKVPTNRRDVRDAVLDDVRGFDAVVHLAGLSNDPLGELDSALTTAINLKGTVRLAQLSKAAGVARFVFASSQSMYGVALGDTELTEDESEKNPVTAYARTKWEAECAIKDLSDGRFSVVCFRPSTVFGASPRLRCDIVFNYLLACAYTTGKIEIKSDGTPWRPVIHVRDVCQAFIAGLEAPTSSIKGRSFNVGLPNGNFTVRQLAEAAHQLVPGSEVVFTGEHGSDSRTYRVSFERILTDLADYFQPKWDLLKGGGELLEFFRSSKFSEDDFRGSRTVRLARIKELLAAGKIDKSLHWVQ